MKLAREVKGNKKGCFKYASSEKETVGLLFKEAGDKGPAKAETTQRCPQSSQVPESTVKICGSEILSMHLCAVIKGTKFSWQLVTSGIPHGTVLGPILFKNFINILKNGIDFAFNKFTNTKLGVGEQLRHWWQGCSVE